MNRLSPEPDRTATQRGAVPTGPHLLLAMCGHKTARTGAQMRGTIAMRCVACVAKGKA